MNRLTVVTYVHPEEENLARCLQGLKLQKLKFKWVILCYTEITGLPAYLEVEQVILEPKIVNKASAYNFILPQITTDYIAYNDADDQSLADRFDRQISFLDRHQKVDILGSGLIINDQYEGWKVYTRDEHIKAFMLINNPMVNSSIMLRNASGIWGRSIRYQENLDRAEDYRFWVDCAFYGLKFANLPNPLINYFQNKRILIPDIETINARQIRAQVAQRYNEGKSIEVPMKSLHRFAEKEKLPKSERLVLVIALRNLFPNKGAMNHVINTHVKKESWRSVLKRIFNSSS